MRTIPLGKSPRGRAFDGTTTFGDSGGRDPLPGRKPGTDDQNLYNDVTLTLTPDGGNTFHAEDAASIAT